MRLDLKSHVLDCGCNSLPPDIASVLREDRQLGDWNHAIVLLALGEIGPALFRLGQVGKQVRQVIIIGVLVEIALGALHEAVHHLIDRVLGGRYGFGDFALEGEQIV